MQQCQLVAPVPVAVPARLLLQPEDAEDAVSEASDERGRGGVESGRDPEEAGATRGVVGVAQDSGRGEVVDTD